MGPNSGGGKRNKNPAPQGAARARFSKWRPPTKNQKEKFQKQHEHRDNEAKALTGGEKTGISNHPTYAAIKKEGNISLAPLLRSAATVAKAPEVSTNAAAKTVELITIKGEVLNNLLRLFKDEDIIEEINRNTSKLTVHKPEAVAPVNGVMTISNAPDGKVAAAIPAAELKLHHDENMVNLSPPSDKTTVSPPPVPAPSTGAMTTNGGKLSASNIDALRLSSENIDKMPNCSPIWQPYIASLVKLGFEEVDITGFVASIPDTWGSPTSNGLINAAGREPKPSATSSSIGNVMETDIFLAMLMYKSGHDIPKIINATSPAARDSCNSTRTGTNSVTSTSCTDNAELEAELEVLSSIYPADRVQYTHTELLGRLCCLIDISVELDDEQMVSINRTLGRENQRNAGGSLHMKDNRVTKFNSLQALQQQVPISGSDSSDKLHTLASDSSCLHIRVIIFNVPAGYPSPASPVYGWILPPCSNASSSSRATFSGTSTAGINAPGSLLPPMVTQALSLQAMAHIQAYQIQFESPAVFEFVQHICEHLLPVLENTVPGIASHCQQQPHKNENEATYAAGLGRNGGENDSLRPGTTPGDGAGAGGANAEMMTYKQYVHVHDLKDAYSAADLAKMKAKEAQAAALLAAAAAQAEAEANSGPPPMPPKPMTKFMDLPEYRSALGQALSAGLKGITARQQARAHLEYVLPQSTLDALAIEEAYHEEVMNRTHSLENLSTKVVIDCTRVLSEQLGVNKGKAKALVTNAKEHLVNERDYFARTEELMRDKLVACAVRIERERAQKKQSKRSEYQRKRPRGSTLREALMSQQLFLQERRRQECEQGSEDEVYGEDGDDEEDADGGDIQGGQYKEDGNDDDEEEFVEIVDPNALLTPEERARRDADSKRLKTQFEQKQKQRKYQDMLRRRAELPAYKMKDQVLQAIDQHNVVVISGDTGCGKTTQVPQLVLDAYLAAGRGGECNILVTQPRRISAMSVAERIAAERIEAIGQSTGYHIRLETKTGPQTRLLLLTTGVLLRKLQMEVDSQTGSCLAGVSHVFVDEVHERDINTDFLLIILKKLLRRRPDLKVILMSATLNADIFLNYFRHQNRNNANANASRKATAGAGNDISCSLISIPGRTFPVNTFYLEDAMQATGFEITPDSPCLLSNGRKKNSTTSNNNNAEERHTALVLQENKKRYLNGLRHSRKYSPKVIQNLEKIDESVVNSELIVKLVLRIMGLGGNRTSSSNNPPAAADVSTSDPIDDASGASVANEGAILVFVPGLSHIQEVVDCLKAAPELVALAEGNRGGKSGGGSSSSGVRILPLHSSLSSHEQNAVFQVPPPHIRKIVVSTNIAETSVTIEDVVYVIDTCRAKENSYDEVSQMNVLEEGWISQANARQRRGRAGRVRSGICYHLVSKFTMDCELQQYMKPDMLKMSLEDIVLQILALDFGDPYAFLRGALSAPDDTAIANALLFLESLGAVVLNNLNPDAAMVGAGGMNGSRSQQGKGQELLPEYDLDSEITPLGFHLAALPINPKIGKLILYGVILECIDPILTIASALSVKSVFYSPFGNKDAADEAKLTYSTGHSDLLTSLNAINCWREQYRNDATKPPTGGKKKNNSNNNDTSNEGDSNISNKNAKRPAMSEYEYCRVNFLNMHSLQLIEQMRAQFLTLLQDIGFMPTSVTLRSIMHCSQNAHGRHNGLIKSAICAGLSPNILHVPGVSSGPTSSSGSGSGGGKIRNLGKKLSEVTLQARRTSGSVTGSGGTMSSMKVHPSSVMSEVKSLDSNYMVYLEAMRTSQVYVRDVTTIPGLILALFSGRSRVNPRNGLVVVDGWISFRTPSAQVTRCLLQVRDVMDNAFMQKVLDPSSDGSSEWRKVLNYIRQAVA